MPLKYSPKVFLVFKLPDGTTHQGFFRQNQSLGEIINALCPKGKTKLDQSQSIGGLGLQNDTIVEVKKSRWPS